MNAEELLLLEKKVGQLFIVGVSGQRLDPKTEKTLSRMGAGGIILFKHNYKDLETLVALNQETQEKVGSHTFEKLPLWISIDQEGGRVQRLTKPFTIFPPLSKQGEMNSPKTSFEAGFVMGTELRAAGINVNFAPVIDVTQKIISKAIGDRAFSDSPEIVASLGSAFVRGLQKGGVLGVAKHFPGHGSVQEDSHQELPVCQKTVEELEACDWIPFRRLIKAKGAGIMTAHITYPKIDGDKPATFSRIFIREILRKQMRHTRLIFTDDLEMGAITKKYSLTDAAFFAISAGCDQILLCHEYDQIEEVWLHLVKAFETGALPMNLLDEAIERIRETKKLILIPFRPVGILEAQKIIGQEEFLNVAECVMQKKPVENPPSAKQV